MNKLRVQETCPFNSFHKIIQVNQEQTDCLGNLHPGCLAQEMQHIAENHMACFGLDEKTLRQQGLLWVLVRTAIWVNRLPKKGESIELSTWSGEEKHWMFPRRYEAFSPDGEKLLEASSQWVLMDEKTRRIAPPCDLVKSMPSVSFDGESGLPGWQAGFPETMDKISERVVKSYETDYNGHLNNARYIDWGFELAEGKGFEKRTPRHIWIEYSRELTAGQKVKLQYTDIDNVFFIRGISEEEVHFSLKIEYR